MRTIYGYLARQLPLNNATETDKTANAASLRYLHEFDNDLPKPLAKSVFDNIKELASKTINTRIMHEGNKMVENQGITIIGSNYINPNDIWGVKGMGRRILPCKFYRHEKALYKEIASLIIDEEHIRTELYWYFMRRDIGGFAPANYDEDTLPNKEIIAKTQLGIQLFTKMFDEQVLLDCIHQFTTNYKATEEDLCKEVIPYRGNGERKNYTHVITLSMLYKMYKSYCILENIPPQKQLAKEDVFRSTKDVLCQSICLGCTLNSELKINKSRSQFKKNSDVVFFNVENVVKAMGYSSIDDYREEPI